MEELLTPQRLSNIIGLIYDAALSPARWPAAMEAIRIELNCCNSTLDLQRLPSGEIISNVATNVPPEYLPLIDRSGEDVLEQWGGAERVSRIPLDRPAVLSRVNPAFHPETTSSNYYLNFAKPQGIVDVLAVGLARDTQAIGSLAFGRHRSAGPIGEREIAIAQLFVPHLQRAATINRMLDQAAVIQAGLEATIDAIAVPVLLLGSALRIVHANAAAREAIARADLIAAHGGSLQLPSRGAQRALAVAASRCLHDHSGLGRRGLGIPVRRLDGSAGAIHVLPLRRAVPADGSAPVAAVFIAEAGTRFVPPTEMVAALFDFSRAEAQIFHHIAQGLSVPAVAQQLGLSRATVRTHLARLFHKTGTHRQADLIHIGVSLTVPLPG